MELTIGESGLGRVDDMGGREDPRLGPIWPGPICLDAAVGVPWSGSGTRAQHSPHFVMASTVSREMLFRQKDVRRVPGRAFPMPKTVSIREVGPRDGLQIEEPLATADHVGSSNPLWALESSVSRSRASCRRRRCRPWLPRGRCRRHAGPCRLCHDHRTCPERPRCRAGARSGRRGVDGDFVGFRVVQPAQRENDDRTVGERGEGHLLPRFVFEGPLWTTVVSSAFGSPYEGDISPVEVGALCEHLRDAGVAAVLSQTRPAWRPRECCQRFSKSPA